MSVKQTNFKVKSDYRLPNPGGSRDAKVVG